MSATPRILLLGGIGTGKSVVASMFEQLGAVVVSADQLGHAVLDEEVFGVVSSRWPAAVNEGGRSIDRATLAAAVFADPRELVELEAITHPAIAERIRIIEQAHPDDVVVVEMPLLKDLVGPGWLRVVVTAPVGVRIERLERRGMTRDDIRARMAAQPSPEEFSGDAFRVLDNAGDLDDLGRQVVALWSELVTG